MNNIFCPNCGKENNSESNFCFNCGTSLKNNQIEEKNKADEKTGNILGIISLVLYFSGAGITTAFASIFQNDLSDITSSLGGIAPLAGIVTMIVGRVKYPKNRLLKIAMWIIIGFTIASIILVILFMLWCYITCSNMDTSGCY